MRSFLLVWLLLVSSILSGCLGADEDAEDPIHGVIVMPDGLEQHPDRWADTGRSAGGTVAWAGPLDRLLDPATGAAVVARHNTDQGLQTVVLTHPWDLHTRDFSGWGEAEAARHRADLIAFVGEHEVTHLGLGHELDLLADDDPAVFDRFATWWQETYHAIKETAPLTKVFPVFQYERMIGLKGGLYGGANGDPEGWALLEAFPERDMTGFTTYPGAIFRQPDHIPRDHYEALGRQDTGPVAFAAVGWHSGDQPRSLASDPTRQAAFVDWFAGDAPDATLRLWARLHDDPDATPPYATMGLVDAEGTPRPALARWRDLQTAE